jgi:hypothetical protein
MVYPDLVAVINRHGLVISEEGTGWTPVTTSRDQHATRQVEGRVRTLGYDSVVARPLPPGSNGQGSQEIPLSAVFIVAGVVLLAVGCS